MRWKLGFLFAILLVAAAIAFVFTRLAGIGEDQGPLFDRLAIELRDALAEGDFDQGQLLAEKYLKLTDAIDSESDLVREKSFALGILARIAEANEDFAAALGYRQALLELFEGGEQKEAKLFAEFAQKQLDYDPEDRALLASAHKNYLQGEANNSALRLEEAHNKFAEVLGEDHFFTQLVLLQVSRVSDVSKLTSKQHIELDQRFEELFGANSIYTADAYCLSARSMIILMGPMNSRRAVNYLDKCQAIYQNVRSVNSSRLALMHLNFANCPGDAKKKSSHLKEAASLMSMGRPSHEQNLFLHVSQINFGLISGNQGLADQSLLKNQELIEIHPELTKTAAKSSFITFAASAHRCIDDEDLVGLTENIKLALEINLDHVPDQSSVVTQKAKLVFMEAGYHLEKGRIETAERMIRDVLPDLKKNQSQAYLEALFIMGEICLQQREYQKAIDNLEELGSLISSSVDGGFQSNIHHLLGIAYLNAGKYSSATEEFKSAKQSKLSQCVDSLNQVGLVQADLLATGLSQHDASFVAASLGGLKVREDEKAKIALDFVMQTKGIVTRLNRKQTLPVTDFAGHDFAIAREKYFEACQEFRQALIGNANPDSLNDLERTKEAALTGLFPSISVNIDIDFASGKASELAMRLPSDVAVVEFVLYSDRLMSSDSNPRYAAFVVRRPDPSGQPIIKLVDVGDDKTIYDSMTAKNNKIDDALLALARDFKSDSEKNKQDGIQDTEAYDQALSNQLWKQIYPHLGNAKTVIVCPSGDLTRVQWPSLVNPSGTPVVEEFAIVMNENASSVLELLDKRESEKGELSYLSVSDVDFGESANPEQRTFPALDASKDESKLFAGVLQKEQQNGEGLTGAGATKNSFIKAIPSHEILHVASHGSHVRERLPERWKQTEKFYARYPLLQNSIVFANANEDFGDSKYFWTGEEVLESDLSHVKLAILSTCRSADGTASISEGIFGIEKALRLAGAQATLTSQSRLDDVHAGTFVEAFTRNWIENKMSKAMALQAAQKEMIAKDIALEFWTGWRLTGDWR